MRRRVAFAVLLAALIPAVAGATTFTITPWIEGLGGMEINAQIGDDVDWPSVVGHDVRYVPSLDGQNLDVVNNGAAICVDFVNSVRIDSGGTANVVLATAGTFYYYCGVFFPDHCGFGSMRVRVNVSNAAVPVPGEVEAGNWGRVKAQYR